MSRHIMKVFAPASVANVAVGYDHLGFAMTHPGDEILVKTGSASGLVISKITGDRKQLSKVLAENTAGVSALSFLKDIGAEDEPIDMEIRKKMPFGSGMGSSAASAAAAVYAVSRYLRTGHSKRELLKYAVAGEQVADGAWHADNVAPSLLGGMVLIRDNEALDIVKVHVPRHITALVIYPHVRVLTRDSRAVLTSTVNFDDAIQQSANMGAFVAGMFNSDLGLIRRSLQDLLVEPQRKHMIPCYDEIRDLAYSQDILGFNISGAGPSMFALCENTLAVDNIKEGVARLYADKGVEVDMYDGPINLEGAIVC
jgi:homoserine kinase